MSSTASPFLGWVSREVQAMVNAWGRGIDATAREVLDRQPDIDVESAIRLIYEETCLRREGGQRVDTAEVVGRYPRWAGELRALLECDRMIRSPGDAAPFPGVGEVLGPFLLLAELGRGASGRTFLASDPTLADRPVVVKVIPDDQDEHLALARLRHTHIVPLFSEHTFPERGLRGLCMPFLGGASLAQILDDMSEVPPEQRTGRLLVKVIDRHTRALPPGPPADGPFRRSLEQATYVQAMTWIAACLGDALHYAHARGLVHMDVKPSNVLITMDGQPILLDFHLARAPMLAGEHPAGRIGGTPGWMSPEQEASMAAVAEGRPVPAAVDGRADIYALGLLVREALGEKTGRRVASAGVGLSDILKKSLATDPRDRYRDAATMADDLRRELDDLPLRGVRNRSLRERWRKWLRRHPVALAWGVVWLVLLLAAGAVSGGAVVIYRQVVGQLKNLLDDGRRDRASGRYAEAIRSLGRGLETAETFPVPAELRRALHAELRLAERGRLAEELHGLADRIRFRHGVELPPTPEGRSLLALCRSVWDRRGEVLGGPGPPLDRDSERRIRDDLLELAVLGADLCIHLAPPQGLAQAQREALRLLDEAESSCGQSVAVDARRRHLEGSTPAGGDGSALVARSPWEHYQLGRYQLRAGRVEEAAEGFRRATELRPQDFWSNFYSGLSGFALGRFEEAAADFRVCIAIAPQVAICHYNRALCLDSLGRPEQAWSGYTRAIELDPFLAPARLNRGIVSRKTGRNAEATIDFDEGLKSNPDRQTRGRLHFNLALVKLDEREHGSARANAEKAVDLDCPEAAPLLEKLR